MISSCMFSSAPIVAKKSEITGNRDQAAAAERCDERGDQTAERPDRSTTTQAAADKQNDADDVGGLDKPRGMATAAAKGPTGAGSTG